MSKQNPLLRQSLLALVIGSLTAAVPAYAQQQTQVPPPQLEQGDPATERVNDIDLNDPASAATVDVESGDSSQAPQPDEVGEDQAVSEAAVDLNVDPMVGNRSDDRSSGPNTLRFGADNAERPVGAIITEPDTDAIDNAGEIEPVSPPATIDGTVATEPAPTQRMPEQAENGEPAVTQSDSGAAEDAEMESDAGDPSEFNEASPTQPATVAPRRMEGVYPMPIEDLTNRHVVNAAGQMLGLVEVAVVNESSGEAGLVVSVGNLTGTGGNQVLAPANQLHLSGDVLIWQTPHTADQLDKVQTYESAEYREIVGSYDSLDEASRQLSEPTN